MGSIERASEVDGLAPRQDELLVKQPELFDIHVLEFSGDPVASTALLRSLFGVKDAVARQLVATVPVVVKRAAAPALASELFEVLSGMGAQVVLLPARPATSGEEDIDLTLPSRPLGAAEPVGARRSEEAAAPAPQRNNGQYAYTCADLDDEVVTQLRSSPPPPRSQPPRGSAESTAPPAWPSQRLHAPSAEPLLEDEPVVEADDGEARVTRPVEAVELESFLPPSLQLAVGESDAAPPAPCTLAPASSALSLAAPPPTPASRARLPMPDLGLGEVPPLPDLGHVPPRPPSSAAKPRKGPPPPPPLHAPPRPPPPPAPKATARSILPSVESLPPLPSLDLLPSNAAIGQAGVQLPSSAARTAADAPAATGGYWAGNRATQDQVDQRPLTKAQTAVRQAKPRSAPSVPIESTQRDRQHARRPRSAAWAFVGLLLGLSFAVLAGGVALEDSILLGNASPLSLVAHGLALYALCVGALGWWRSSRWHLLWLAGSSFLAFGLDAQMTPEIRFEHATASGVGTGKLELVMNGRVHELELASIEILARDVPRMFGAPIEVRELLMVSPRDESGAAPDLQVFADFAAPGISPNARDMGLLRDRELALLPEPPGREQRSQLRLPGASSPAEVVSGTLRITDAVELDLGDGSASFRVGGQLEVQLRDGDAMHALSGRFKTRLRWP